MYTTRTFILHALVVTAVLGALFIHRSGGLPVDAGTLPPGDLVPPSCLALLAWACAGVAIRSRLFEGGAAAPGRPPAEPARPVYSTLDRETAPRSPGHPTAG